MGVIQELIRRYKILIRDGQFNPYYESKEKWQKEVQEKINELETMILHHNT